MTIMVYDVDTQARRRNILNEEYINNINELFEKINEQVPTNHVLYNLADDQTNNPINQINNEYFNYGERKEDKIDEISENIANKLLEAELITTKEGVKRRNLNITQGILIIKFEENNVSLLKFEEASNVNPNTFAIVKSFSLNSQYYKYAKIRSENYQEVIVVDRSEKVAKYWAEKFLGLVPNRTPESNTKELIDLLEKKELFNKTIEWQDDEIETVEKKLLDYIYENQSFTKENFFRALQYNIDREGINADNIFTDDANEKLDAEFNISKKALNKKYGVTLPVSDSMSLFIENIKLEKRKETISLSQDELVIKASSNHLDALREKLGEDVNGTN